MRKKFLQFSGWKLCLLLIFLTNLANASSHREAPLISNDPLADNTDVYAFRSPDGDQNTITIIANYIPFQLPDGGPNYYTFGQNIRYEIHIKNKTTTMGDDITYRFTFTQTNQDPTTFFNIRLGQQNIKTTYICEKSMDGGNTYATIINNGIVPANNIGPRSIESGVGLDSTYTEIENNAINSPASGEKVFCGPRDDPFFVDLAGAFDVGNFRPEGNSTNAPKDGLARFNVHSIAMKIPISMLQKDGKTVDMAANILDGDFVIGVWASASRQQMKTITTAGAQSFSGNWVQVSRLGMPLTNEVIIPVGMKDKWNSTNPYAANASDNDLQFASYFKNPELALYMDDSQFGGAVPSLNALRIQKHSLGSPQASDNKPGFDFRNTKMGLFAVKGTPGAEGTAFAASSPYKDILLPDDHSPRAVDLLPIFYTGVPNLPPYQLFTGKAGGNPLAPGKPFINNFLPTLNDMLRLNMAVPPTQRNDAKFSSLGLLAAAAQGLLDPDFANGNLQAIPNMDGFPNGRRLEDDVTTIELQAVSGVVLAVLGLWYDDYNSNNTPPGPVTPNLLNVLSFSAGPTKNDTTFKAAFPYAQTPWRGFDYTIKPRF